MNVLLLLIGVMATVLNGASVQEKTGLSYTDSLVGGISKLVQKDATGVKIGKVAGIADCVCPVGYMCLFDHGEPHCVLKDESLKAGQPVMVSPLSGSPSSAARTAGGGNVATVQESRGVIGGKIKSVKAPKATLASKIARGQASNDEAKRQRYYRQMGMMGVGSDYSSVITPPRRYASNRPVAPSNRHVAPSNGRPAASSSISRIFSNMQAAPSNIPATTKSDGLNAVQINRQMGTMGVAPEYSDVIAQPPRRRLSTSQNNHPSNEAVYRSNEPAYPNNDDLNAVKIDRQRYQMGTMGVAPAYSDVILPPVNQETISSQFVNPGNEPVYPNNEPVYPRNGPVYPNEELVQLNNGDTALLQLELLRDTKMGMMGVPAVYSEVIVAPPRYHRAHHDQYKGPILSSFVSEVKTRDPGFHKFLDSKSTCSAVVPPICWELTSDLTSEYRWSYSHVTGECQKMNICWECVNFIGVEFNLFRSPQECQKSCLPVY